MSCVILIMNHIHHYHDIDSIEGVSAFFLFCWLIGWLVVVVVVLGGGCCFLLPSPTNSLSFQRG